MFDERAEEEPDDPDLGPEIPDIAPEEDPDLGPRPPDVSPESGFWGPDDAPKELLKAFWTLVVLFNVGLLSTSLGLMLVGFQGRIRFGGALLAIGLIALARGFYGYYTLDLDDAERND